MDGLWIELYEEFPVLDTTENEEGEEVTKVSMTGDKPRIKTAIRGVAKIDTSGWLMHPNLTTVDMILHKKFYFFKLKYKTVPEFKFSNHYMKFKPSEHDALDAYVKDKRERIAQKEAEEREKAEAAKATDGKKDAKKDKGGKKADDKNAVNVEIEDPEDIEFGKGTKTTLHYLILPIFTYRLPCNRTFIH